MKFGAFVLVLMTVAGGLAPKAGGQESENLIPVTIDLELEVNVAAKTWDVYLSLDDPLNLTAGLQAIELNVIGNGITVETAEFLLPEYTETSGDTVFQKGFYVIREVGPVPGMNMHGSQPPYNLDSTVYPGISSSVITGIGLENVTVEPQGESFAARIRAATGTWDFNGSTGGSLEVTSDSTLNALLPAPEDLPAPADSPENGDFSSSSASEIINHRIYLDNPDLAGVHSAQVQDLVFAGRVEVGSDVMLTVDQDLIVANDLTVAGVVDAYAIFGGANLAIDQTGVTQARQYSLPYAVDIDGAMYIYDTGLDSVLGQVTVGPDGSLILTSDPVGAPAMLSVSGGTDPYAVLIPEPGMLGLLGMGALALIRRRR
ncbi:MAG: PEP-CTERM sorting domain-containing protein [Phycisphaerae bacterium]